VVRLLTVDRPFPAGGRYPSDPYIGSKVCAECHPGEAALYARSGHAMTLRPAARLKLAHRLGGTELADPELPDVRWRYRFDEGRLRLERDDHGQVLRWVIEYAFGSGHHATTFVNIRDPAIPEIFEHRLTYYASKNSLGITPGQHADEPNSERKPHGSELTPQNSRKCLGCHATDVARPGREGVEEEMMIPNVSCERCHGPGRAHVMAARQGASESELSLPFGPQHWTAESLMMLCGSCHRHPSRAHPGQIRPDDSFLARFQPVGIMQSNCYRRSGGSFSCVNCHDPHSRPSADRGSYDSACLTCHAGSDKPATSAGSAVPKAPPCTTSPQGRCVACHMPRVDTGQSVLYTDHWIRIRQPGAK
jgi:hypothetical protein